MATVTTTITSKDVRNSSLMDEDFRPIDFSYTGVQDDKLATIASTGKVANSATTATPLNTPSTIVARDGAGSFAVNAITANSIATGSFAANTLVVDYLTVTTALAAANAPASFSLVTTANLNVPTAATINSLT